MIYDCDTTARPTGCSRCFLLRVGWTRDKTDESLDLLEGSLRLMAVVMVGIPHEVSAAAVCSADRA